jgi:OOP family OmpA-OmpF porin
MNPKISQQVRLVLLQALLLGANATAFAGDVEVNGVDIPTQPGRPMLTRRPEVPPLRALQARLDAIGALETADCETAYAGHKTQAWLNFSRYAIAEQLPHDVRDASLANATNLLSILEQHNGSALDTPQLPHSEHVRNDLWIAIAAVKRDGRRCVAPKMTAFCEVQLAWVDYEAGAGGWRHVDPYVRIAEDYCGKAIAAEVPAPPPPPPVIPPPPPVVPPQVAEISPPSVTVLFHHDRWHRDEILPPGPEELAKLVSDASAFGPDTLFQVDGYADITGNYDYNQRLSARRARSVAEELQRLGVATARIHTGAHGDTRPVLHCRQEAKRAGWNDYLQCLEPNRRVVVETVVPAKKP